MTIGGLIKSLFSPTFVLSTMRTLWYKYCCGYNIGSKVLVYYKAHLYSDNKCISIGEKTHLGRSKKGYHAGMPFHTTLNNEGDNAKIIIGRNCRINGAYIHAKKSITIGDNCVIAGGVNIIDCNGHIVGSSDRTKGTDPAKPITIGNNVWIGQNAIILKDTIIGDNSVIGAGCVVKGNFPPNSLIQLPQPLVTNIEIK